MPIPKLSKLVSVDVRTVWPMEGTSFTPWLLANAEQLSEVLHIDVELKAAEHKVGGFSLDLLGRDIATDEVVIVENQFRSDGPPSPGPAADLRRRHRAHDGGVDRRELSR